MKKKLNKKLEEELEVIEATGQESEEKARKWVKEVAKTEEKKEKEKHNKRLEYLEKQRKLPKTLNYKQSLMKFLHDLILEINLPKTFSWGVWYDGVGIRVDVADPMRNVRRRAFKISYSPEHDINACYLFSFWIEKIYNDYKGNKLWVPKSTSRN
jgi:hypothetical protein